MAVVGRSSQLYRMDTVVLDPSNLDLGWRTLFSWRDCFTHRAKPLVSLKGWEDAACKYTETLVLPSTDLDKLIKSRFKHAIADPETRNQLLWVNREMTLNQMVQRPQQFKDFQGCEGAKPKKSLRTMNTSSETSELKKKIEDLQKQIANLQSKWDYLCSSKDLSSVGIVGRKDTWPRIVDRTRSGMASLSIPNISHRLLRSGKTRRRSAI